MKLSDLTLLPNMSRPMKIMLLSVGILFGAIFIYKATMGMLMKMGFAANKNPVMTVSTTKASYETWQPEMKTVGSTRAILGVNITAQLGGMISNVYFTPGAQVKTGDVLVQQNASTSIAKLHALEASAELAKITYERDKAQYKVKAVSKQQLDSDFQNMKNLNAQVAEQAATVYKLSIRAPFDGRLGISQVNPGQYLNPGDPIVTIQQLDPIYVDFYLPQQDLPRLSLGQEITMTIDSYPDEPFTGKITTINPIVETSTRNVEVEATVSNPKQLILPGMFTNVRVKLSNTEKYITLPQSAVSYNPYGSLVYIVYESKAKNGSTELIAKQKFVTTGDARGDQVAVLTGVSENDTVVTSGQLKLKNGSRVAINNSVQPRNNPDPKLSNEHQG